MRPMGEVQRLRMLTRAKRRAEGVAAEKLHDILQKRYKVLKRELRRANLRKRLNKTVRDTGSLFKQDELDDWNEWITSFEDAAREALTPIVVTVQMVEEKYWQSRGARPDPIDPDSIFDSYEDRTGRQIRDIAEDTKTDVLEQISDWYNSDMGFPELIDSLGSYFSEERSESIARTESSFITSEYSNGLYEQFGIEYFNVEPTPDNDPWPCEECLGQAETNPHRVGDQMPPFHTKCECGTSGANADGSQFMFGQDEKEDVDFGLSISDDGGNAEEVRDTLSSSFKNPSFEQRASVVSYEDGLRANRINDALRSGNIDDLSEADRRHIDVLSQYIDENSLSQRLTVTRGSNLYDDLSAILSSNNVIGSIMTEKGFMSTAANPVGAYAADVKWVIDAPAGTRYTSPWLIKVEGEYVEAGITQSEIIFRPGTSVRIDSVEQVVGQQTKYVVHATIVE
jgi:ADP-ribosyltransferase exoenzyme